jgi:hypothetical protein
MAGFWTPGMPLAGGNYLSNDSRIPVDTGLANGASPQSGAMRPGTQIADPDFQALTAQADGTKANATQLSYGVNTVGTVAGAADSVILPLGYPGARVTIINTVATAIQVFGSGTDTIQGVASATGNVHAASIATDYICYNVTAGGVGQWWKLISA